jgi:hypothetical protein
MSIIVKKFYLPGFSEPERDFEMEEKLNTNYGESDGGLYFMWCFSGLLKSEVKLILDDVEDAEDPRNKIIATCLKTACVTAIWWMVENPEHKWSIYSGSWNEEFGFMVANFNGSISLWLSDQVEQMRQTLDLLRA